MIDWQQFHFLRPAAFALLAPLALLLWYLLRRRSSSRGWAAVCDAALLPHILMGEKSARQRRSLWPVALAGVLITLAMAGPTWSHLPQPVFSSTQALVIALDLSRSMNVADVAPSRIERARFKIADLLKLRRDGQTALIVYAGDAFTVAPLTDDAATLMSQLPALVPGIMPTPGNRSATALTRARELLKQSGLARGDVLLITDETEGEDAIGAATALRAEGYRVSVLGVGTEAGAPIPLPEGGFLKDDSGEIVIAALDETPLRQLAVAGAGIYQRIAADDADINALTALLDQRPSNSETQATELQADVWRDQGPWLVLALLPLAALGFRRGLVLALALTVMPLPRPAQAMEWEDLWLRADQQGKRALDQGEAKRAAELFQDPRWRGAAQYQAGDFPAAAEALAKQADADSLYNQGNALARQGKYPDALAAYDQALTLQQDHDDAKFNRELVQKQMQPPPQEQQSGDQQSQDQGSEQQQAQEGTDGDKQAGEEQGQKSDQASSSDQESQSSANEQESTPQGSAGDQSVKSSDNSAAEGNESESGEVAGTPAPQNGDAAMPDEQTPPAPLNSSGAENEDPADKQKPQQMAAQATDQPINEDQQALEQWLRRIPDDPGGLLRRKFQHQYQMRRTQGRGASSGDKTW